MTPGKKPGVIFLTLREKFREDRQPHYIIVRFQYNQINIKTSLKLQNFVREAGSVTYYPGLCKSKQG